MNIKALVAALVLGSSSLAAAATTQTPTPMEHRTLPSLGIGFLAHVVEQPAPMVLANDTRLAGTLAIKKVATSRAFTKLELRANDGKTTVTRVVITYANGTKRTVKLKSTVIAGTKTVSIDVANSRAIKSISVVGSSKRGASIDVFAS